MSRAKLISILVIVPVVLAVVVGAVGIKTASASTSNQSFVASNLAGRDEDKGIDGIDKGYLAEALGITEEELASAIQEAKAAALSQAVEDGLITQTQADELKANGKAFPFGKRWGSWLSQQGLDFDVFLADALGINVDELQAAYAEAFNARVDQAVADGKVTEERASLLKGRYALRHDDTFVSSLQSAYESAIKQAVENGVITQEQADLILEKAADKGLGVLDGRLDFGDHRGRGERTNSEFPQAPMTTEP